MVFEFINLMKRIRFNTTWEQDEKERREYFSSLSYQEKLQYFYKNQEKVGDFIW
jgi:hypothetical protein